MQGDPHERARRLAGLTDCDTQPIIKGLFPHLNETHKRCRHDFKKVLVDVQATEVTRRIRLGTRLFSLEHDQQPQAIIAAIALTNEERSRRRASANS